MARVALLVGTSEYLDEFKPLKSAIQDVEALAKVLKNTEIGGFDDVQIYPNVASGDLAPKIETWYLGHAKDDLALLFIAGHGAKDADRKLHFVTKNTQKVGEKLITTTAISASNISAWMGKSKARRQIVILNCCFSGAFGDLVPMDEGAIDFEEVVDVEGRVVMTSTSSMEYAFERLNGELSVYGHYLEEGLRTGAAAATDSDEITIDKLHQYVSRKVQEETPSMVPKIFAKGEGYQLRIAKVALGDPTVQYRKEVDRLVQMFGEPIERVARFKLHLLQEKLNLHDFQVNEIEDQVLEPIRQRKKKLQEYRDFFTLTIQDSYPFDEQNLQVLSEIKQLMGFLDEDVAIVEAEVLAAVQPELAIKESVAVEFDRLEDLLRKQQWKEANDETMRLLLCLADRRSEGWLLVGNIRNFSQDDLNTIDALWSNASQGRFGLGIQAQIFEQSIANIGISKSEEWQLFDDLVEWRKDDKNCYQFTLNAPEGHLPNWRKLIAGWGVSDRGISFLRRGLNCPIGSFESIEPEDIVIDPIDGELTKDKYAKLQKLLGEQKWLEADEETYNVMVTVIGNSNFGSGAKKYPQDSIEIIDRLWAKASGEKFGFIVQARIWQQINQDRSEFDIQVGWKLPPATRQISRSQLKLSLEEAPIGHFPAFFKSWGGGGWSVTQNLLDRVSEFLDPIEKNMLTSERVIDYTRLHELLEKKDWRAADQETYQLMLKTANRKKINCLDANSLSKFPCEHLKKIDDLWMIFSQKKFGFSIQQEIWDVSSSWVEFSDKVGWRKDDEWQRDQDFLGSYKTGMFPRIWFPKHEWCRPDLLRIILLRLQEAKTDSPSIHS